MNIFDRFRNRQVRIPEMTVNGSEAAVSPAPEEEAQGNEVETPSSERPRKLEVPGKIWA